MEGFPSHDPDPFQAVQRTTDRHGSPEEALLVLPRSAREVDVVRVACRSGGFKETGTLSIAQLFADQKGGIEQEERLPRIFAGQKPRRDAGDRCPYAAPDSLSTGRKRLCVYS